MLDTATYTPRLLNVYRDEIRAKMKEEFGYKNDMMIPRLDKVVLNIGCGAAAVRDSKKAKSAQADLTAIAGQKAMTTIAKKSIAGFRVREEMPMGAKVTLRGARMYEFMDRLITIAMPRIRDFRGISAKSFDGRGNYAMGLKEHLVFPEIDFDKIDENWGMDIVIATTAQTDAEKSMIAREKKREALVKKYAAKRAELKAIVSDESKPMEERFRASLKLAKLPRNSSAVRLHNRCQLTGRPHAYYRKLKISRIALRDLGSAGQIPGMVKSSW